MEEPQRPQRRPRYHLPLGLAAVFFLACLPLFITADLGDLSGDSARYLLLGKALAEGHGCVEIEKPGAPPHTEYGPGLPAMLAPVLMLSPGSVLGGKMVVCFFSAAALVLTFLLARKELPEASPMAAAMITLALASLPYLARFANQVLSDLPYAAVSLLSLFLVQRALEKEGAGWGAWFFGGVMAGVSFLFRQLGVALFLGIVAGIVFQTAASRGSRARAVGFFGAGFILIAGAWLLRNYLAEGSVEAAHFSKLFMARDADPFAGNIGAMGVAARAGRGIWAYFNESATILLDMAWPLVPRPARMATAVLVAAPVLYGFVRRMIEKRGPLEWYFVFYLIIICAWQSHNPRYLLPVLPVALIFAAHGIMAAFSGVRLRRAAAAAMALFMAVNLGVLAADLVLIRRSPLTPPRAARTGTMTPDDRLVHDLAGDIKWGYWFQYPDFINTRAPENMAMRWHHMIAAAAWMRASLPEDAVVMARKPRLMAWYSQRMCVQYIPEPDPGAFAEGLAREGVTHLLVDEVSPGVVTLLKVFSRERPKALTPVFSVGRTHVLAVSEAGR